MQVLKCLKRGKALTPGGILNEMILYGGGMLEVMLQVINLVMSVSPVWQTERGVSWYLMVAMRK